MALNTLYASVGEKLHEALLTSPATKADAATYIITTGGLALPQAGVETAIDFIIADLAAELILDSATYAALLAKHQAAADPNKARAALITSNKIVFVRYMISAAQAIIDAGTAQYAALSQAQKDAIVDIKAVADEGVSALTSALAGYNIELQRLENRRALIS